MFFAMMVVLLSSCAVDMPISELPAADDAAIKRLVENSKGDVSAMRQCLYIDSYVVIFPYTDGQDTIVVRSYDPIATIFLTVLATIFACVAFYLISFCDWELQRKQS